MRPYGQQPTRLLCPRNFLCKNTGVGCHFLPPSYTWITPKAQLPPPLPQSVEKKKVISQNQSLGPKRLGATALIDFWQAWPLVYSPPLPFALPPCPATLQFWFKQVRSNQPPTLSVAFPGGFTVLPGSSLPASSWPFPPTSGVSHPFLKKCCF